MTDVTTLLAGIKTRERVAADYPGNATIEQCQADVPRLVAAIEAVTALHMPDGGHNPECHCGIEAGFDKRCSICGDEWPCPTITAVATALGGGE